MFEDFPSGRNPNSEVAAAAAALNGASRLQYINPRQGRTRGGSGGIAQPTFPSISHGRGDELSSAGIYKHRESVGGDGLAAEQCVLAHLKKKKESC